MIVIGIENLHNISCQVFLLHSLSVISLVEGIQLEALYRLCIPDSQSIYNAVAISYNREIKGNCPDCLIILLLKAASAILITVHGNVSAEFYQLCIFRSAQFKGISVFQPVIRHFYLITVLDFLLEHTIAVTDAAAVSRVSKGCQRIQETCSQSSQTAVSKGCIRLLVLHQIQIQSQLVKCLSDCLLCLQVNDIIAKGTTHQKFHGHIIYHFGVLLFVSLLGINPVIHNLILDGKADSLKNLLHVSLLQILTIQGFHVINNTSFEKVLIKLFPAFYLFFHFFLCVVIHVGFSFLTPSLRK